MLVNMFDFAAVCLDEKNRIVYHKLLGYLIKTNNFINSDGFLYHYSDESGRWCNITNSVPNVAIRSYIPPEYQTLIDASKIKKIVADLIDSAELVGTFKKNEDLINVKNGVINLKTLQLLEHSREFGFNYVNNFNYQSDAKITDAKSFCSYILSSLGCESMESHEVIQVLEIIGYVVSELRSAEKAVIALGESNTGKSVLLKLLEMVFQADEISGVGLHELDSPFRFSALAYSRINLLHEVKPVRIKCVDEFKKIVSCEDIISEEKGQRPKRVRPRTVWVCAANTMPNFTGMELNNSIVNRLLVIRFLGAVEPDKINRNLLNELAQEIDTIFSAGVNTLPALMNNEYLFTIPASTSSFMDSYAKSLNSVSLFIDECCEINSGNKVFSKTLYNEYVNFVKANMLYKNSEFTFGMQVRSLKGIDNKRIRIGKVSLQGYEGIGLKIQSD